MTDKPTLVENKRQYWRHRFMWMFTKHGFFSAVCARQVDGRHGQPVDPDCIMVRARVREHLESLKERFPELLGEYEILESAGTDYAYRLFVQKSAWMQVVSGLAEETDYDNFKSEVAHHQGRAGAAYEHSLHEVWSVMNRLQGRKKRPRSVRKQQPAEKIAETLKTFDSETEIIRGTALAIGGTHMLFSRLERAAVNQAEDGEATLSRYVIWANTVRDHIAEAIRLVQQSSDTDEAKRLLIHAHNSMSAFSEIQALFDPLELGSTEN